MFSLPDRVSGLEGLLGSFIFDYIQLHDSSRLAVLAHIAASNMTPEKSDLVAELKMIILPSISLLSL